MIETLKNIGFTTESTRYPYEFYRNDIYVKLYKYSGEVKALIKQEEISITVDDLLRLPELIRKIENSWEYRKFVLHNYLTLIEEFDKTFHPILSYLNWIRKNTTVLENGLYGMTYINGVLNTAIIPIEFKYSYSLDTLLLSGKEITEERIYETIFNRTKAYLYGRKNGGKVKSEIFDTIPVGNYDEIINLMGEKELILI